MNDPKRTRVFIVDDSPQVRERLIRMLSELPTVEVAGQAAFAFEAISSIRNLRPDVLILDISMPGGNGLIVLEAVQNDKLPILTIVLTNFTHAQYRQKCLALGAHYFFDKSAEFEKVLEVLREVCSRGS